MAIYADDLLERATQGPLTDEQKREIAEELNYRSRCNRLGIDQTTGVGLVGRSAVLSESAQAVRQGDELPLLIGGTAASLCLDS